MASVSSSSGINFSGLASGVDTSAIIEQLMQLERVPIQQIQLKQTREQARQKALGEISTALTSVRTAADAVRDSAFWAGGPTATSGDEASYTGTATASAAKASYQVRVDRLATPDVWRQQTTAGVRRFAATYSGPGVFASGSTLLTSLRAADGSPLAGLAVGTTIAISGAQGSGTSVSRTFTVTATSTLDNLRAAVAAAVPGSQATIDAGGRLTLTSPPGTDGRVTTLGLSTGGAAPGFDALYGTSTDVSPSPVQGTSRLAAAATLRVGVGSASDTSPFTFDVALQAGWSMDQVAAAVNAVNGGATASVVDGRLQLASTGTGVQNRLYFPSSTGATALGLTDPAAHVATGDDALVTVDGVAQRSASNTATTVIPGTTLTLKRTSATATTLSVDPNAVSASDAEAKVKKLVDTYNTVIDAINVKLTEKAVKDPKTDVDRTKGTLFADPTLVSIKDGLQRSIGAVVSGLATGKNIAAAAGITTGAVGTGVNQDTLAGRLQFDSTRFQSLLASDRAGLTALFLKDGADAKDDGLAQRLSDLTKSYTTTGGMINAAIDGSTREVARMQASIDAMTGRLDATESRLKTQFMAMERAIAQLNDSRSSLSSYQPR